MRLFCESGYKGGRIRTSPGDTTVKAPAISRPCSRTDPETASALLAELSPGNRTSRTPKATWPGGTRTHRKLGYIDDVMAVRTQAGDDRRIDAFVAE